MHFSDIDAILILDFLTEQVIEIFLVNILDH